MDNNAPNLSTETEVRQEVPVVLSESLSLPVEDNDLIYIIDKRINDDDAYYRNTLKLDKRSEEMRNFWIGNQIDEAAFANWQVPYKDNIIWQNLEQRIAIAAGRMPDIIVTPADDTNEKRDSAKEFERVLDLKVRNEVMKRIIKDGLRHLHLSLKGAIKVRWDRNRSENGDFLFELVRPGRYGVDHTATIPHDGFTADNCELIYEWLEEPVGVIAAKFPDKRDELFKQLGIIRGTTRQMIAKIRYLEVWFTWYDKEGKIYEGTAWKYQNLILGKMKNPYWDWEGYEKNSETKMNEDGTPVVETFYRNHFDRPRKPYILFSYQSLGEGPYDATSAVEQAIPLQKTVNKRGRQITEIGDRAVPKIAFSGLYISKEQARRVTNDPDEHIWVQSAQDIRQAVQSIPANQPSPVLYTDLAGNRAQIDSKFATNSTTRGEEVPQESGISKQITREGNLVVSDDIASVVVERVVYEAANWATQMMKVNYTEKHLVKNMGQDGEMLFKELTQDAIDDGIMVNVKASSVDKAQKRADALQLAARKGVDPYNLLVDMDYPNPKERTKQLIFFLTGGDDGYARYLDSIGVDLKGEQNEQETGSDENNPEQTNANPINPTQPPTAPNAPQGAPTAPGGQGGIPDDQALQDIRRILAGETFDPQPPFSKEYVETFRQYVLKGGLEDQPDEIKKQFMMYVEAMMQLQQQQLVQ